MLDLRLTGIGLGEGVGHYVAVYAQVDPEEDTWAELGTTEVTHQQSATFDTTIIAPFSLVDPHFMKFLLFREDAPDGWLGSLTLSSNKLLGRCGQTTVAWAGVDPEDVPGVLTVTAAVPKPSPTDGDEEEPFVEFSKWKKGLSMAQRLYRYSKSVAVVSFALRGKELDAMDALGKSDPFFRLYRLETKRDGETVTKALIMESEVIKSTLNPEFLPRVLPLAAFGPGGTEAPLLLEMFDWDRGSSPDFIGHCQFTVAELVKHPTSWLRLINPAKAAASRTLMSVYTGSGNLEVDCRVLAESERASAMKSPTKLFQEYMEAAAQHRVQRFRARMDLLPEEHQLALHILGGCEFRVSVGIGFDNPDGRRTDQYAVDFAPACADGRLEVEVVAHAACAPLEEFSDEGIFAFGFGGHVDGREFQGTAYPLSLVAGSDTLSGCGQLYECYRNALTRVTPLSTVNVLPYLEEVQRLATAAVPSQANQTYMVAVCVLHGMPANLNAMLVRLAEMASLPVSVILVGCGDVDYALLRDALPSALDAVSSLTGVVGNRPNTAFVPLQEALMGGDLRQHVLGHVAGQFAAWLAAESLVPNDPIHVPEEELVTREAAAEGWATDRPEPPVTSADDAVVGAALVGVALEGVWASTEEAEAPSEPAAQVPTPREDPARMGARLFAAAMGGQT